MKSVLSKFRPWQVAAAVAVIVLAFGIGTHTTEVLQHRSSYVQNTAKQGRPETIQDASAETVANYTEVLAWFTGVLALVSACQIYFLIRSDKRAAEASEQAGKQFAMLAQQVDTMEKQKGILREQFFAEHRPRLVLKDVYFSSAGDFNEVTFEFANVGGGTAIVTGGFIAFDFISDPRQFKNSDGRSLAPLDKRGFADGRPWPFAIRLDDKTQRGLRYLITPPTYDVQTSVAVHEDPSAKPIGPFYFFGIVYYTDGRGEEFGVTRASVFRRVWRPDTRSFHRTGDPDHEYAD